MITVYGLRNCDSCRKARAWLADRGVSHRFHDFRGDGIDLPLLEGFEAAAGWEGLINRRGTTWRQLSETERAGLDRDKALRLMLAHPALIKRPILAAGERLLIGFSPERFAQAL